MKLRICIAGGCGTIVANGKIKDNTKFKNIFIQAAAGDAGVQLAQLLLPILIKQILKEFFK